MERLPHGWPGGASLADASGNQHMMVWLVEAAA